MLAMLLTLLMFVEAIGCCLVISAIAWLRYLYKRYLYGPDAYEEWQSTGARYVLPPLSVITTAIVIYLMVTAQPVGDHPNSPPPDIEGMTLFGVVCGLLLMALIVWLVIEARRYRARHQELSYVQRLTNRNNTRKKRTRGQRRQRAL